MSAQMRPQKVSDLDIAFPTSVAHLMPPAEVMKGRAPQWAMDLFCQLFYRGGSIAHLVPKPGVDRIEAIRHIKVVMGNYEPKHEDKEVACAHLFAMWFEEPAAESERAVRP